MKKIILILLGILLFLFIVSLIFYSWLSFEKKNITWGVDFSQMQAERLGLDWKQVYTAMLQDLQVKNIKIHTQWDWVEGEKGDFYFDDIDWQINQSQKYGAHIIYVVGMKTGRWPECHLPEWAQGLSKEQQQEELLTYIKEVVNRYKDSSAITYWQVENEPFLNFGECPSWYYDDDSFLKKEVDLVKSLDSTRKVIISDSGELSWWFQASSVGDILGTTMYRKAWVNPYSFGFPDTYPSFYGTYPIAPVFYYLKSQMIKYLYHKDVICIELQAEPWAYEPFYNLSIQEQEKTMNPKQFDKNVEYAKKTGIDTFYFWGVEWWYWLKEKHDDPTIWDKAGKLFNKS